MSEASRRLPMDELKLLQGSVMDLQKDIVSQNITKEETLKKMQMLLNYMILL